MAGHTGQDAPTQFNDAPSRTSTAEPSHVTFASVMSDAHVGQRATTEPSSGTLDMQTGVVSPLENRPSALSGSSREGSQQGQETRSSGDSQGAQHFEPGLSSNRESSLSASRTETKDGVVEKLYSNGEQTAETLTRENGSLASVTDFKDGKPTSRMNIDENNNTTSIDRFDQNGRISETESFARGEDGKIKQSTVTRADGTYSVNEFQNGKMTSTSNYAADGSLTSTQKVGQSQ